MRPITFDPIDVARLIVHSANSPKRQASWGQKLAEGARRRGVDVDDIPWDEWPEVAESITDFAPPPCLTFVHDQGLYLMSPGEPPMDDPHRVIYAKGFDPNINTFEEFWEGARDVVGGDDFVEPLPLDDHLIQVARDVLTNPPGGAFTMSISDEQISYGFIL